MKAIIGIKKGMTRVFKGEVSKPVTVIEVSSCVVTLKDAKGYELGAGKKLKAAKALSGKYKALGFVPQYREYFNDQLDLNVGDAVKAETFVSGSKVTVTSVGKGKGFAGVVKRWGFAGGPKTHGQSDRHRAPGSIGAGTTPGRVLKGKRMGGRMGSKTVTLHNREIIDIVENYILVSGPVAGNNGDKVVIKSEE